MLELQEHFDNDVDLTNFLNEEKYFHLREKHYSRKELFTASEDNEVFNFSVSNQGAHVTSSYFVGLGWLIPGQLPIRIRPKLDDPTFETDYFKMVKEALEDFPLDCQLENLLNIDFTQQPIEINEKDEGLNLFVVLQFIFLLHNLIKRGLLRSFHQKDELFNCKIKGKILFSSSVTQSKDGLPLQKQFFCSHQTFDENVFINRLLKSAFVVSRKLLQKYKNFSKSDPSFERKILQISHKMQNIQALEHIKTKRVVKLSPFFKNYKEPVRLAQLILRLAEIGAAKQSVSKVLVPPYWINMTKLFELYVFAKLKKSIKRGSIDYHLRFRFKEPDFRIRNSDLGLRTFIADAKYKPRYSDRASALWEDGKQLSGYSRFLPIRNYLKATPHTNIPCVILYSDQSKEEFFNFDILEADSLFEDLYLAGIKLPQKRIQEI